MVGVSYEDCLVSFHARSVALCVRQKQCTTAKATRVFRNFFVKGTRTASGYFMHTMFCRLDPVLSLSLMANERHRVETVHAELLYIHKGMMPYRVQVL